MSNYLVVDLEGTCCNDGSIPDSERETIEIGAVMVDSAMQVIAEFDTFVKPVRHSNLTKFCQNLTGIRQSDIDEADQFPLTFAAFCHWIERQSGGLFCSWGPYDKNQFKRDCEFHGMLYPFKDHLDLSRLFTRKFGKRRGNRRAMKILGIEPEGPHHRGIDDARNIVRMLPILLND